MRSERAQGEMQTAGTWGLEWQNQIGFEQALSDWQALLKRTQLPPVWLIEGREGLGKEIFIARLISVLYCHCPVGEQSCGECSACRAIIKRAHPEIFWLNPEAKTIKLEEVNELLEHLQIKSSGPRRLAVIIDCERLTTSATNRLLKRLEEPDPATLVLLTTSRPALLLPTLRSRCAWYHLKPPAPQKAVEWLSRQLIEQKNEHTGELHQITHQEVPQEQHLFKILKSCGYAPYKALEELRRSLTNDLTFDLETTVKTLLLSTSVHDRLEAAETLGRELKDDISGFLTCVELTLGQDYQSIGIGSGSGSGTALIEHNTIWKLTQRRQTLKQLRKLAIKGKIALNVQLAAETLAFAGLMTHDAESDRFTYFNSDKSRILNI